MATESEFLNLAERTFEAIEERFDDDFDGEVVRSGNVLKIVPDNGNEIVLNLQTPWQEIWLASRLGGYHFRYVEGAWRDTRTNETLDAKLEDTLARLL